MATPVAEITNAARSGRTASLEVTLDDGSTRKVHADADATAGLVASFGFDPAQWPGQVVVLDKTGTQVLDTLLTEDPQA